MPPIKVMALLLTGITPFVMVSGTASAAEPQIILVQAPTPQQQEDEKNRQQQRAQDQQRAQQQRQAQEQQQRAQEQQRAQQQKAAQEQQQRALEQRQQAQEQQQKALEQQRAQQQKAAQEQQQRALEQRQQAQEQQQKALEQQRAQHDQLQRGPGAPQGLPQPGQPLPPHNAGLPNQPAPHGAPADARIGTEQTRTPPPFPGQQRPGGPQLQPGTPPQQAQGQMDLRRELSAEEQKARFERDAHQADRLRLIQEQERAAQTERSQAAINDRLRLQNERLREITSQRREIVDPAGHRFIQEPGNRTIFTVNNQTFIRHDETQNFRLYGGPVQTRRGPGGFMVSDIRRPDGSRIEVEVDSFGRPIRRVRYLPDGRRFVLFENPVIAAGLGLAAVGAAAVILPPPPPMDMPPPDQYMVDASVASEDDIYGALYAPPIAPLDRPYSLDQVLASKSLRDRMRSITINTIHFDFGSAEVVPDQAVLLEPVAAAIREITTRNPGEVFLIEGHTDAVGSDLDNLSLSDRRAQAVADVLSQQFGVPRENLVTQGYGKQFLLVPTDGPERRNRRVVVRRISPLLQGDQSHFSGGYGSGEGYGGAGAPQ